MYSSSSSSCRRFTLYSPLFFRKIVEIEPFALPLEFVEKVGTTAKKINYGGGERRKLLSSSPLPSIFLGVLP